MALDEVGAWREAHERVCALVEAVGEERMLVTVPATPDWTARDLLSHVVGYGADVLRGEEPDDHNEAWTQAQVDARRGRTAAELVAEWREVAPGVVEWMREHGTRPLGDVVIHEQDLRGALDEPGARDTEAFAAVRDRMAGRFGSAVADLPPIELRGDSWRWSSHEGEPAVVLEASDFDLGRALMSRRTAEQIRGWVVAGDVTPYVEHFGVLGPLPEDELPE